MLAGAMNSPRHDPLDELRWMAAMGLDFVDLTLEPPRSASWQIDVPRLAAALEEHELGIVGHTAYYLPLASPFDEIRRAAVDEIRRDLEIFAALGARWVNIHPDRHLPPLHNRDWLIERNLQSIGQLLEAAAGLGLGLMVENLPGEFNTARQLGDLLDPLPELGLHLDIGHCNLRVPHNTTEEILSAHGRRLRHVHLHDNLGGHHDLHLPLGAGTVNLPRAVRALKAVGYDGTITLEVFSPDRHYLAHSRDLLRQAWDAG